MEDGEKGSEKRNERQRKERLSCSLCGCVSFLSVSEAEKGEVLNPTSISLLESTGLYTHSVTPYTHRDHRSLNERRSRTGAKKLEWERGEEKSLEFPLVAPDFLRGLKDEFLSASPAAGQSYLR